MTVENIIKENNAAWMSKDQLNGTPAIGAKVKMAGIEAEIVDVDFVDSHNCWVVRFEAANGKQEVPATKVAEAIKSGKMEVV